MTTIHELGVKTHPTPLGVPEEWLVGTPKIDFKRSLDLSTVKLKTAIVTGGASGIGLGIVKALASAGAAIAVLDRNQSAGEAVQKSLEDSGTTVKYFHTDVSSWDSQLLAFKEALRWSNNELDIVVLSAGIGSNEIKAYKVSLDLQEDPIKPKADTLDVNLTGTWYSMHLALSYFTKVRAHHNQPSFTPQLLFVSSLAGFFEQTGCPDYCASKHGVRGMWKAVRKVTASFGGAQVNLVAPGFVDTPLLGGRAAIMEANGVKVASIADAVAGAMRCICDENVSGRAVGIAKSTDGVPGSANFDLCDDMAEFNSGEAFLKQFREGAFYYAVRTGE